MPCVVCAEAGTAAGGPAWWYVDVWAYGFEIDRFGIPLLGSRLDFRRRWYVVSWTDAAAARAIMDREWSAERQRQARERDEWRRWVVGRVFRWTGSAWVLEAERTPEVLGF